jgi:hypothetical protein
MLRPYISPFFLETVGFFLALSGSVASAASGKSSILRIAPWRGLYHWMSGTAILTACWRGLRLQQEECMPAIVSVNYLDNPDTEKMFKARIEQFMEPYEGQWAIKLIGSQQNTIWEMTVKAPDGKGQWVIQLYGEDGGHSIEKILAQLQNMVEKRSSATS